MKIVKEAVSTTMNLYCCMYTDCSSEYSTKFNLKRHVESVHMHVKRFQCPLCKVYFSSKQSLKEHQHIHSGMMPFTCLACGKLFRQASQLSLHKRVHILEGKTMGYIKLKVEDRTEDVKPIEVNHDVITQAFTLPTISSARATIVSLPYPIFNL